MDVLSTELVKLLLFLTPGLLAAWIFFGLTAYERDSPFERIVQALIFTAIVQVLVIVVQWASLEIGKWHTIGYWTENVATVWSFVIALALGLAIARCANWDLVHTKLRDWGFTANTSYPSEWFSAFKTKKLYVVLHFKDERRLHGWPEQWPDHQTSGEFLICNPKWLLEDGSEIVCDETDCIVVLASDVELVEFMKFKDDVESDCDSEQVEHSKGGTHVVEQALIDTQGFVNSGPREDGPATDQDSNDAQGSATQEIGSKSRRHPKRSRK
jgi:hypothetical protein